MTSWWSRPLAVGDTGRDVAVLRRLIAAPDSETFTPDDAIVVRGLQYAHGLPATGVVDEATAGLLGEPATLGFRPLWFVRDLEPGMDGTDVAAVRRILGLPMGDLYDLEVTDAVRRYQSAHRIYPTGTVDADLAALMGD